VVEAEVKRDSNVTLLFEGRKPEAAGINSEKTFNLFILVSFMNPESSQMKRSHPQLGAVEKIWRKR